MINILFGAVIASVVPIVTLYFNHKRWKMEQRMDTLRLKHDKLERIYKDLLECFYTAMKDYSWPKDIRSQITIYGSKKVQNLFWQSIDVCEDKIVSEQVYFDLANAINEHLSDIEKSMEKTIS